MSETKLSSMDKDELKNITKAYSEEEYLTIIKVIPDDYLWEELMRRENSMLKGFNNICEILGASFDNLQPIPAKAWSDIKTRYDDLRDKFSRIRKGFGK